MSKSMSNYALTSSFRLPRTAFLSIIIISYSIHFRRKGLLMKKVGKIILIVILAIIIAIAGITAFLTITEFKPEAVEPLELYGVTEKTITEGSELTLLTYNIGYGGLSADMDLYSEGGEGVIASTESLINKNMDCIRKTMKDEGCDILLLQNVDKNANRSHGINEATYLTSLFPGVSSFAQNYKCKFIPLPVKQPLGTVNSGLLMINKFPVTATSRIALVSGYSWPQKLFEPKNCIQVQRVLIGTDVVYTTDPIVQEEDEDTNKDKKKKGEEAEAEEPAEEPEEPEETEDGVPAKRIATNGGPELVIINAHFETLDNGDVKIEQTKALANFAKEEYSKGNYVIIGGCFNQTFPDCDSTLYPLRNTTYFMPGVLEETLFGSKWSFAYDERVPTARLLNAPYSDCDPYMQCYVIDGFICSPNVSVIGVRTIDTGFRYSNHNPVKLRVVLGAGYTSSPTAPNADITAHTPVDDPSINDVIGGAAGGPAAGNTTGSGNNGYAIGQGVLSTDGTVFKGTN